MLRSVNKWMGRAAASAALALSLVATVNADLTVVANFAGLGQGNGYAIGGVFGSESDGNGGEFLWQNATFTNTADNSHPTGLLQAYPNPVYTTGSVATPFPHAVNDFISFCIQINQNVNWPLSGPYAYTLIADPSIAPIPNSVNPGGTGMGLVGASLLEGLWYSHITSHYQDPANAGGFTQAYALDSRTDAGAFQMLVWKLVYDGSGPNAFNPDAGNITLPTGGDGDVARAWLSSLSTLYASHHDGSGQYTGAKATLIALVSDGLQDQIAESQYNPNLAVPEPTSLLTWSILGLAACIGGCRARRGKG